ncbi:hypothetical protein [Thalassomonas haliotis]|uniref:Transmembrane anchor protein n=1 Tax=Thalassomonas haliotis TaxID=485448 RepID=A0ABY7VA51_9GAMM|nr:hypothetical protein [Thalassomonas haliotis]WDE10105.1 hypothetical protein H3N35_17650 [Thalassomonas haliotis]
MNTVTTAVHSTTSLVKASVLAAVLAALVLAICILPSEYNIDPTGMGKALGLTQLAGAPLVQEQSAPVEPGKRTDTVKIEIPAGKGLEYKLLMEKYAHLEYEWHTGGQALYFDFHGEPKGDTTGYFESFAITTSHQMKGSLTTPFAGSHGWYWKNTGDAPVVVTLSIKGDYSIKG